MGLPNFEWAFRMMRQGKFVRRTGWNNENIKVGIQHPDENSFMTKPYFYMQKGDEKFPLDMSCEALFAEDWEIAE